MMLNYPQPQISPMYMWWKRAARLLSGGIIILFMMMMVSWLHHTRLSAYAYDVGNPTPVPDAARVIIPSKYPVIQHTVAPPATDQASYRFQADTEHSQESDASWRGLGMPLVATLDTISREQPLEEGIEPLSRVWIPSIDVDRRIEPIHAILTEESYGTVQTWPVPQYTVGHHSDSGSPGDLTNIVLTGHVGGSDPVFDGLIDLEMGTEIILYTGDISHTYRVESKELLQEVGVSLAQQQQNAKVLDPTAEEVVTIITCWPPRGPHAYDQRLVIRARPVE